MTAGLSNTIEGFVSGDRIDLAGVEAVKAALSPGNVLQVALAGGGGSVLTVPGVAEDGYLVGATVGYATASGGIDTTQPTAKTDATGSFALSGGTGALVLTGGRDRATGLAFGGTLQAPAGSTVISPLTSLLQAVISASGETEAAANAAVLGALGLPAGVDLTTLDAVAGTLAGDATASSVFQAASAVENIPALIQAAAWMRRAPRRSARL